VQDGYNAYIAIDFHKSDAISGAQRSNEGFANLDWSGLPGGLNTTPGSAANAAVPYATSTTGYLVDPNSGALTYLPGCSAAAQNANHCTYSFPGLIQPATEQTNVLAKFTKSLANDWTLALTGSVFVSNAEQVAAGGLGGFVGTNLAGGGQVNIAFGPGVQPHLVEFPSITVPANAPYNTTGTVQNLVYNFSNLGPTVTDTSTTTYRLISELKGELLGWDIDADIGGMYSTMSDKQFGDLNYANAQTAINDGAFIPGVTGTSMNSYLAPEVEFHPSSQLDIAGIQGQRELVQLPGGPLSMAVGAQYYYQAQNAQSAPALVYGIQEGDPVYTIGSQDNVAVFTEFDAQILKSLEVDAAVRYDHYNTYGGTATPKFGVKYRPIDMLTLRGTFGRGFRAPSISESGVSGEIFGAGDTYDPVLCPGGKQNVAGTYNSQCTVPLVGYQVSNPQLKAVESTNLSFGFIFEPIENFNTSVDYYKIRLTNDIISQFEAGGLNDYTSLVRGLTATLPQCTNNANPCATQNVTTPVGLAAFATYPYVNAGITQTEGIDIDMRTHWDLGIAGKLRGELNYTRVFEYNETVQGTTFDLAGTHGPSGISGDTGNPKDRGTLSLTWERSGASLTVSENYTGPFSITDPSAGLTTCQIALSSAGTSAYGPRYVGGQPLPAAWNQYCDVHKFIETNLYASYNVDEHLSFHGSVTNLFNANAPVDLQTYGGGAELAYDGALEQDGAVGRYFTVGVTYKY
jgi:iron complex outermembrane receptor protein